jgi:excinuclease UvrABC helicase subunit UvrB
MNLGLDLDTVREEVTNLLGAVPPTSESAPEPVQIVSSGRPDALSDEERLSVEKRIRLLEEEKESLVANQDFEQAARCRNEASALKRLLAWYDWSRDQA